MAFMSHAEEVVLSAFVPGGSPVARLLEGIRICRPLHQDKPLQMHLVGEKPIVVVFVYGFGDEKGFYCSSSQSASRPRLLPDTWWKLSPDKKLYLFALCCESASYIENSSVREHVAGSIGFEGKIWIDIDLDAGKPTKFWEHFNRDIRKTIMRRGKIDDVAIVDIEHLYVNRYRKARGFPKFFWDSRKMTYLTRVCLVRQMLSMRMIEGNEGRRFHA